MKTLIHTDFLILILFLSSCNQATNNLNSLTKKEKREGWELMFDGKSLDNWKMFNGGEITGWRIVNGELHNSGIGSDHGGDIITKKQYENFELYLEWKLTSESNSGIFYHVEEGKTDAIYESGPEYQLIDDKGWPTELEAYQYTGSNYGMNAPENGHIKPTGEWNSARIIVKNPHVEHWLNGVKVVEYELWSDEWNELKAHSKWEDAPYYGEAKSGHIGIQDHGGLAMFRNIKIRSLN